MSTETYNLYSTVLAAATLLATGLGLVGVFFQIRKLRESAWATMHSKLCDQNFELLRFLSETPDTWAYFYANRRLDPASPDHVRVLYQTQAVANFLEHVVLQQSQLPAAQWAVWERVLRAMLRSSDVVYRLITEHPGSFSADLVAIARQCAPAGATPAAPAA